MYSVLGPLQYTPQLCLQLLQRAWHSSKECAVGALVACLANARLRKFSNLQGVAEVGGRGRSDRIIVVELASASRSLTTFLV